MDCSGLLSLTIGGGVRSIGTSAFQGCFALTNLTIFDGVTDVGMWAFTACDSLTHIELPHSLIAIGSFAFSDCPALVSVTCPQTLNEIGAGAFAQDKSLDGVYFMGDAPISLSLFSVPTLAQSFITYLEPAAGTSGLALLRPSCGILKSSPAASPLGAINLDLPSPAAAIWSS